MISFLLVPIMGGVIGYLTNWLAIKMLFRPRRAHYILGHRIPLTPGIIPKEMPRIAHSLGTVVSDNLLDHNTLQGYLVSDAMMTKVANAVDGLIVREYNNEHTLEEVLNTRLGTEESAALRQNVTGRLSSLIVDKISDPKLGEQIATMAVDYLKHNVEQGLMGRLGASIVEGLRERIQRTLQSAINNIVSDNAPHIVSSLIEGETDKLMQTTVAMLMTKHADEVQQLRNYVIEAYRKVVMNDLERLLQSLDIATIVEQKINSMDVVETERLLLQVMNKELKAIIWLGAVLGTLMGLLTLLLQLI